MTGGSTPPARAKLNIFVRRDFAQKSYRMAMAVHAALLWEHRRAQGLLPNSNTAGDWQEFPDQGPIVAIYGVENREELIQWTGLGDGALYHEPDLVSEDQEASFAWYGPMPADHGLRLL